MEIPAQTPPFTPPVSPRIRVDSVRFQGSVAGIIDKYALITAGVGVPVLPGNTMVLTTEAPTPLPAGFVAATFSLHGVLNPNFSTKCVDGPTGERFYPGSIDWTGPATVGADLHDQFAHRSTRTTVGIDTGFHDPNSVATSITQQLHEPSVISTRDSTGAPFVDLTNYYWGDEDPSRLPRKGDPLLVATPTFQPVPCNFNSGALPGGGLDTVAGALNAFWSQIAVLEPGRWELGSILRGLAFGDDDSSVGNEIYSGPDANTNQGDNQNQTLGNLGLIPRSLTATVDSNGDGLVTDFGTGRLWLTNILFTDSVIKKLGAGFRAAEQYNGDKSAIANNDTTAFGVNLQFGLMVDELSNGYPLTLGSGNTVPPRNQRTCFLETRVDTGVPVTRFVDAHTTGPTQAVDSDGSPGDGCSLPNVWVKSRWSENLVYPGSGVDWANSISANSGAAEPEYVLDQQSFSGTDRAELLRLQALARDNDVAVVPFWWANDGFTDRPFLAFVNQTDLADWPVDISNAGITTPLGFDCSFIRNPAVAMYNIQSPKDSSMITALLPTPSVDLISAKSYNPILMLGAADPIISFDAKSSRFSISGLHTGTTIAQGPVQAPGQGSDPTDNPEQPVVEISLLGALAPGEQATNGTLGSGSWRPRFLDVLQSPSKIGSVVDSQSGVAIIGLRAPSVAGEMTVLTKDNFSDCLLGRCGFSFEQLLPTIGTPQARFVNRPGGGATALTYKTSEATIPRPFTTNAFLSSAEYQSLGLDASGRPTYSLGTASWQETRPSAVSADLTAADLPNLLDYPYLMVHSDAFADCAGIDYRAGNAAISPCFGWVSRSESAGDFIYGSLSSFAFTATKSSALTSIEVAVRDPTGRLAALQKNNVVIFKITRQFTGLPAPPTPPPPQK